MTVLHKCSLVRFDTRIADPLEVQMNMADWLVFPADLNWFADSLSIVAVVI